MNIQIKLNGNKKEKLEDIPLSEIAEFLKYCETILKEEIVSQRPTIDANKLLISASSIVSGSAIANISSNEPEELSKAHLRIVESIKSQNLSSLAPDTRKKIISFQEFCKKKNKTVCFDEKCQANLLPELDFKDVKTILGETNICGELISIGNQQPTAKVLTSEGYTVRCVFPNKDFAKKISSKLYETISLKGKAKWNAETWKLEEIIVSEILNFDGVANLKNLEFLADLWQGGNYEGFMEVIR